MNLLDGLQVREQQRVESINELGKVQALLGLSLQHPAQQLTQFG